MGVSIPIIEWQLIAGGKEKKKQFLAKSIFSCANIAISPTAYKKYSHTFMYVLLALIQRIPA